MLHAFITDGFISAHLEAHFLQFDLTSVSKKGIRISRKDYPYANDMLIAKHLLKMLFDCM